MSAIADVGVGINRSRGAYSTGLWVLGVLFLITAAVSVTTLIADADKGAWGVFTATFINVLSVTQLGIVWTAIMRICNTKWGRPFYRVGEVTTLAFMPFAILGFLLIYAYGRDDLLYWVDASPEEHLSPWLNEGLLLWRNLLAQILFYAVALWYFVSGLLPDIDERGAGDGPAWRQALHRWLLSLKAGKDMKVLQERVYRFAPVVLLAYALPNTFISWDFGMMLWPHYHSTVFTMYYMQGALFAGTVTIVELFALMSLVIDTRPYVHVREHIRNFGIMLTAFALLWVYLFWAQFFVTWFGNLPREFEPLWSQMYGHYAPFFWLQIVCIVAIPIGTLIFAWIKRTWWTMLLLGLVMNVGVWINRYLMVLPPLLEEHVLFANPVEIALLLAPVAGLFFLLLVLFNAFPMISMWEMRAIEPDPHALKLDPEPG